jgi:hypothetical protein
VKAYNINLSNGNQRLNNDVKLAKLESINNGDQTKKSKFSFKPEHLNVSTKKTKNHIYFCKNLS